MKSLVRSLSSLFMTLLVVALTVLGNLTCSAATKQRVSEDYMDKCFTSVAAASCLGVYLPENSTEFNYLRAYGWRIMPQKLRSGRVE